MDLFFRATTLEQETRYSSRLGEALLLKMSIDRRYDLRNYGETWCINSDITQSI